MLTDIARLRSILTGRDRREILLLLAVMIVAAALEVCGVGAVFTFMRLVTEPELVQEHGLLKAVYDRAGFGSPYEFLVLAGLAVLVAYLVKNAFAAFSIWLRLHFVFGKRHTLATRLLRRYMGRPYSFFLANNTSNLTKNIIEEVDGLVAGIMFPMVTICAEAIIVMAMVAFLLWNNAILTLIVIPTIGAAYAAYYLGVRRTLARRGEDRLAANELRYKAANQALSGIKEIKVAGTESYFLDAFAGASLRVMRHHIAQAFIGQMPRYVIETIAMGGMLGIVVYFMLATKSVGEVVATASLFAVAGMRMMPSANTITSLLARRRFQSPVLHTLYEHLAVGAWQPASGEPGRDVLPFDHAIVLQNVGFRYPGADGRPTLADISLTIPRGGSVAFVGPTGAGKSTLVDLVAGLLEPTGGDILIDEIRLHPGNVRAWQNGIGYVPQNIYLADDTLSRNIAFGVSEDEIDMNAVQRAAEMAQLAAFVDRGLPDGYASKVGERGVRLSGGQRQRVGIARALYRKPSLLVMDEATSALDGATEAVVNEAIASIAGSVTMIVIAHRLTTVRNCDVIYLLEDGRIRDQGAYQSLMSHNTTFRAMAGQAG